MQIKYKIIETDLTQHSIVVRYFTDYFSEDNLATSYTTNESGETIIDRNPDGSPKRCQTDYNINVWQTDPTPTEEDLLAIAKQSAPYSWFKLRYDVLNPNVDTSLSAASSLLGKEFVAEQPVFVPKQTENLNELSEEHIESLIRELTANTA
jgi:hypothetical protein